VSNNLENEKGIDNIFRKQDLETKYEKKKALDGTVEYEKTSKTN